jgi:RNA polymerase sigma-70 factor (ECF subfamily)
MNRYADRRRWSDRELLAAIAGIDREAFTVFYRRHLPVVLAFLAQQTAEPETAADLTAEVFAVVMLAARRYEPQHESAVPWLIGIGRNVLSASRRKRRVQDRARQRLRFDPIEFDDSDLERVLAIVDQGRGDVERLLASLPADERDAVRARVLGERSYADIAAELRCSELVVRKRVSRGLGRLREQIEERQ